MKCSKNEKKTQTIFKIKSLLGFHWNVQCSWPNSSFNTSFIPFMSSLCRFLRWSDAFLQIWLNRLNGHIFQIFTIYFFYCAILTCFWKNMTKTSSLEVFFQPNIFITYKRFQYNNHGIEIINFIFEINNDFFSISHIYPTNLSNFYQGLSCSFTTPKQANSHMLWLPIIP